MSHDTHAAPAHASGKLTVGELRTFLKNPKGQA
jgi:hypothetical protein